MKLKGKLIIIISIILVLIGLLIILSVSTGEETDKNSSETVTVIDVIKIDAGLIKYSVSTAGESYSISYVDGQWVASDLKNIILDQSYVSNVIKKAKNLSSETLVEENASDLSKYGIDNPSAVVEFTDENNVDYNLKFGMKTATQSGYYAVVNDDSNVYIISTADYDLMCGGIDSLRNKEVLTIDGDVTGITIENPDNTITVKPKTASDPNSNNLSSWEMITPYHKDVNEYIFEENVINALDFTVDYFIDDNPADYSGYGLSDPEYTITVTTARNNYKILLGNLKDGSYIYMKTSDKPNVYAINKEKVLYRDFTPVYLLDSIVFARNLISVDNILFNDGNSYVMKTDGTNYYLNGSKVDETLFRETFLALISPIISGEADKGKIGKKLCEFTFNYNTNTPSETVVYYEYGEMYAAASVNGSVDFYVKRSYIDEILKAIKKLAE